MEGNDQRELVTVIVKEMPKAEYKLYISDASSPRLTWIKGR